MNKIFIAVIVFTGAASAGPKECSTPAGNIAIVKAYLANIGHPVVYDVLCDPNTDLNCLAEYRRLVVVIPKAALGFDPRCHLATICPNYVSASHFNVNAPENNCELYRSTPVRLSEARPKTISVEPTSAFREL